MATSVPQQSESSTAWQTSKQTVRDKTAFLFNNSLMSDIKFVVTDSQHKSDGTQVRVPAHKRVLANSSPVFEAMFYGDLAEKREEIELPDTEAICLLEFLRFIYCDEVNLSSDNVLGVLYVAKKYIVSTLAAKCRLFLEENTDETNVCQILEEARKFGESELEERCWEIIDGDTSACLESDRVLPLSRDALVTLFKETVSIEEVSLFKAAKRWAEAKCEEKGLQKSGSTIREMLGDAFDLIRFPTMSEEDFVRHVSSTGLLTSDEERQVQHVFHNGVPPEPITFSCEVRGGELRLVRCDRFNKNYGFSGTRERYNEATENLTFMTDEKIFFRGVRVVNEFKTGQNVTAMVRLVTEQRNAELRTEEGTYTMDSRTSPYLYNSGFDVLFKFPIKLRKQSKYVIQTSLRAIDDRPALLRISRTGPKTVHCAGVTFTFAETSGTNSNHITELLFYAEQTT